MRSFTKTILMLLFCTLGVLTAQAKTEKVHATFENPGNTNTTWNAETRTFTWSTTYYNQLRNIGLPTGDLSKYKKLVIDCTIKSGDQFRVLFYKGGGNKTLYASNGVNEFILADTLKALYPDDYNEYLLACDEICLSGNNNAAPGEAVINDVYLETYDDEGEKVYATFENPNNTNTTWNAETRTFTWSTTYYNQLRNIGLPTGDLSKYKKLVIDCNIKSGDQFRVLFYKGGANKTLYASNGVNEFILADTLKALYPDDYNEFLLACDEICLSGNNAAAPGEAVINSVYLETYPENEQFEIPEIQYEEDPGKPAGDFTDFTEAFPELQPRLGLGTDGHPIVLGNGEVVVGQRSKDVIADLSAYSKLTIVTSPNLKLVLYMNHEIDAKQNAGDYSQEEAGKYVFLDVQANENGIIEVDLTQFDKQDLNCICLPWDNSNKGTVWYLLLTQKESVTPAPAEVTFDFNASNHAVSYGASGGDEASEAGDLTVDEINTIDGVVMTITPSGVTNPNRYWRTNNGPQLRMYGGTMTLQAPEGKAIVKVVFNNGKWEVTNTINGEVAATGEWEGNSTNVILAVAKNTQMNSVVVTLADKTGETTTYEPAEPVSIANTAETAYTVAKAVELIDAGEGLNDFVFVKGIVSKVENFKDGAITYWISDDGTTEGQQFECYKGKGIDGANFAAIEDVEVGAVVIVTGQLTKYNDIYEFKGGNKLVSYEAVDKPLIADGTYYIYNKSTQKYLAAGAAWGTHAVVAEVGLDYTLTLVDGKYTIDSQVSNGGNNHFLNGEWNDGAAFGWTFAQIEDGSFTISDGTKYITVQDNGEVTLADDATVEAAHWTLIAAADMLAANMKAMEAATADNGVDATFLIKGANFNRNDLRNSAWKATKSGGNQTIAGPSENRPTFGCESWNNTFEVSQTIENLPDGVYEFSIAGFGTNGTTKIFINETDSVFINQTSAANFKTALDSIANGGFQGNATGKVAVIGGILKIGVKRTEQVAADWAVFDNARLTYYGAVVADAYKPAYDDALAAAQAALANEAYAAVTGAEKDTLTKAIARYATVEENADAYKAAIAELTAVTAAFTAAKADYEALVAAKAGKADFDFAAYPYASAEKKTAAETSLTAEAANAADAKAKAEGIDNLFRKVAESSALLESVEGAIIVTDSIKNPNAEEAIAEPWVVVNGEGSNGSLNILANEPLTDGEGNSAYKYFDGGNWGANSWDVALVQKIALPAGKYQLTAAGRAAAETELKLFVGADSVQFNVCGSQGALYGRGWSDASIVFELAEADSVEIGVRGVTTTVHNWMSFTRFRLAAFYQTIEESTDTIKPEPIVIEDGIYDLTSDMFKKWASHDAAEGEDLGCSVALNQSTSMVYGDSNVFWLNYANLTGYDKLVVIVSEGAPRFCFNRTEDNAQDNDDPATAQFIDIPGHAWGTDAYQTKDENDKRIIIDLKKMTEERGFAHLHAIKSLWGQTVTVVEMKLLKGDVDMPSGITIVNADKQNATIYNLNGLRVNKATKGLYIVNGKKMFVK